MQNDNEIKIRIEVLQTLTTEWLEQVRGQGNQNAWTDRKLETILKVANEIKELYETDDNKAVFVDTKLKPLLLASEMGWTDICYKYDDDYEEYVYLFNKNPDKSTKVSVTADSNRAIMTDVMNYIL